MGAEISAAIRIWWMRRVLTTIGLMIFFGDTAQYIYHCHNLFDWMRRILALIFGAANCPAPA